MTQRTDRTQRTGETHADELAETLQGAQLGAALLEHDLAWCVDLSWLADHGVVGSALLDILRDNGELDFLPVDAVVELFIGQTLVDALVRSRRHTELRGDNLARALARAAGVQ